MSILLKALYYTVFFLAEVSLKQTAVGLLLLPNVLAGETFSIFLLTRQFLAKLCAMLDAKRRKAKTSVWICAVDYDVRAAAFRADNLLFSHNNPLLLEVSF